MRLFVTLLLFALAIGLALSGCTYLGRDVIDVYSRAEIDAINIEGQCKLLARNLLQVDRCKVRR